MEGIAQQKEIIRELQQRILAIQGKKKSSNEHYNMGLGPVEQAFPGNTFPTGVVHEFVSPGSEEAAATCGFITGLLSKMMSHKGFYLWASNKRKVFPPALKLFGIDPASIIFINLQRDKDVLWVVEEALKSSALIAVIGELRELDFAQSRRLQLAVEKSSVTGFIHRIQPKAENTVACVTRWKISPLPGIVEQGIPGVGLPQWNIQLTKVRNGRPGCWQLAWTAKGFKHIPKETPQILTTGIEAAKYA